MREAHPIACNTNKEIPFIVQKICFYFLLHDTINDVIEVQMLLKNVRLLRVQYTRSVHVLQHTVFEYLRLLIMCGL